MLKMYLHNRGYLASP